MIYNLDLMMILLILQHIQIVQKCLIQLNRMMIHSKTGELFIFSFVYVCKIANNYL